MVTKDGDIIQHDYRREKISPDDLPPQLHLRIWGVRPLARKEDRATIDS